MRNFDVHSVGDRVHERLPEVDHTAESALEVTETDFVQTSPRTWIFGSRHLVGPGKFGGTKNTNGSSSSADAKIKN